MNFVIYYSGYYFIGKSEIDGRWDINYMDEKDPTRLSLKLARKLILQHSRIFMIPIRNYKIEYRK